MAGGIRIEGLEEFQRGIVNLSEDLAELEMPALASLMAGTVVSYAPHRTGALRRSVRPVSADGRASAVVLVDYGGAVNYRPSKVAHFLQKADSALSGKYTDAVDDAISEVIERRM